MAKFWPTGCHGYMLSGEALLWSCVFGTLGYGCVSCLTEYWGTVAAGVMLTSPGKGPGISSLCNSLSLFTRVTMLKLTFLSRRSRVKQSCFVSPRVYVVNLHDNSACSQNLSKHSVSCSTFFTFGLVNFDNWESYARSCALYTADFSLKCFTCSRKLLVSSLMFSVILCFCLNLSNSAPFHLIVDFAILTDLLFTATSEGTQMYLVYTAWRAVQMWPVSFVWTSRVWSDSTWVTLYCGFRHLLTNFDLLWYLKATISPT